MTLAAGASNPPREPRTRPGRGTERGTFTAVYTIGSLADDSFTLVVLTISAEPRPAQMSVVHGVPGLPVGFYVNGTLTLPDFPPGTVTDTDPPSLPEGEYDIDVVAAGGDLANPAVDGKVIVPAGANATTSRTWPRVADRFNQGLAVPNTTAPRSHHSAAAHTRHGPAVVYRASLPSPTERERPAIVAPRVAHEALVIARPHRS